MTRRQTARTDRRYTERPFVLDSPRSRTSAKAAMELAIRERERSGDFKSLEDFCSRLDSRIANRKMLESLTKPARLISWPRTRGAFRLH